VSESFELFDLLDFQSEDYLDVKDRTTLGCRSRALYFCAMRAFFSAAPLYRFTMLRISFSTVLVHPSVFLRTGLRSTDLLFCFHRMPR
jgi:hypothetical protein